MREDKKKEPQSACSPKGSFKGAFKAFRVPL